MSGWTALTVTPSESVGTETVETVLEEIYGEDACSGYADMTAQVGRNCNHETEAQVVFDAMDGIEYVAIVSANDTSDSGYGTVWTTMGGDTCVTELIYIEGYEGARGADVVGKIDDEYGIPSYRSWEA